MLHKFLNPLYAFIVSPAFAGEVSGLPDAWVGTRYGACYTSVAEGMSDVYGPDYSSDDNIGARHVSYGVDEMIVSVDRTSGTNASQTIFEKRANGNWCVVLTSPPVSNLAPIMQDGISSRPLQWVTLTQASPGYPETKIIYTWNKHKSIYFPSHCYHVYKNKMKKFECRNAYEE
ncbi:MULTISPECIES: hypothetical protein [Paraburkholderia]|uniref:hypothetical protein n=1 Tax=Paraburkholderia TaxID=1822464 RepID=UPI00191269DE|nr:MULTISPECIES: hypothetical protein [Paraburkholderia]MBK5118332.1 hypothetical protein [Burkholderia sp. R-69980]MBK5179793.1 hypothetical protein [Burkholderia sp. R-69749]MCI0144419.1 hypothetical protein [Paraburkholderia sediminicola]CAE6770429.1 hypothetical protein R69749_01209 [Paraburkholderia domus]